MRRPFFTLTFCTLLTAAILPAYAAEPPAPTAADLPYGDHTRQVMDFWQAESDKPTPVVFYIHGGGWQGGDKAGIRPVVQQFLDEGISVAAINYRYVRQAVEMGIEPPVKAPLSDAARALQFLRSKAGQWNIDKKRIGATGGSAGGCSSLYLALHDDMADTSSNDPVARESTRLYCAAVRGAQTTLDPVPLIEWMPNYRYGAHAFGLKDIAELSAKREQILPWIREYSPATHVSADDPPIGLYYGPGDPNKGDETKDPTHSALLGLLLEEKLKAAGVETVLVYGSHTHAKYRDYTDFLIRKLKN